MKDDTVPFGRKSKADRPRPIENWRDHAPVVPGSPVRSPQNGRDESRWRRAPWGCPPPQYPPRADYHPYQPQRSPILLPDMSVPPPGFNPSGPNPYRWAPPTGPAAGRGHPGPNVTSRMPCPPRPAVPGSRSVNYQPSIRPRSNRDFGSDKLQSRNGTGPRRPFRFNDSDLKSPCNLAQFNSSVPILRDERKRND